MNDSLKVLNVFNTCLAGTLTTNLPFFFSLSLFQELRSIRNLLTRRGLYTETIRKVCNGAVRLGGGLLAFSLALMLSLLLLRRQ